MSQKANPSHTTSRRSTDGAQRPSRINRARLLACGALVVLANGLAVLPTSARAVTISAEFEKTGDEETVFDWSALQPNWSTNGCDHRNAADLSVRAIRNSQGQQQLLLTHTTFKADGAGGTIRLLGTYLGAPVQQQPPYLDCVPVFTADLKHTPSSFNNYEWLAAPYSLDGQTIYALTYDEYRGDGGVGTDRPFMPAAPNCTSMSGIPPGDCQYSSIKLAKSTDFGNTYVDAMPEPGHVVATLPYT